MKAIRQFLAWLKNLFWIIPTSKPARLKATDVINQYVCVKYHDQWINIKKSEVELWNKLGRHDRRGMALRFKTMERKGILKFEEINGKMTAIYNKDYEGKADAIKHGSGKD